jgi:HK97 family phage portal protein
VSVWWGPRERRYNGFTAQFSNPPIPSNSEAMPYTDISLARAEASLQKIAVWSSTDLIASLSSELPVDVYQGVGPGREQLATPAYLQDPSGQGYGLQDWAYQVLMSWLLRGNLFGKVVGRDPRGGFPTQVVAYHPDEVSGWLDADGRPRWRVAGREVTDVASFFHRRVHPMPGRLIGLSPIEHHAMTIGLGLTATQFGVQWFRDGAHPSGMLTNEITDLNPGQIQTVKQRFMAALRGTREPIVLGKGWKWQALQVNPDESQFLETQKYTSAECARIFGPGLAEVLGYESGGSLTYTTVEGRSQHLLVYSLSKWLRRLERLLTGMLPRGQYARLNRDALLQSTTLDRYKAHESALRNRWKTVNEVRSIEDEAPVAWGDEPNAAGPAGAGQPPADEHIHDDEQGDQSGGQKQ